MTRVPVIFLALFLCLPPLRADTATLQVSPSERAFFRLGYQLGKAAFAYADLAKHAAQISTTQSQPVPLDPLAGLAPIAARDRADARDGFTLALGLMQGMAAPDAARTPVRRASLRLGKPLTFSGDSKRVAVFSRQAAQSLASLDEFNALSSIPEDAAIQRWTAVTPSGRVWYAEGLVAALAEIASANQMPELLPPVKEIATDLRGLRDWLSLRLPDLPDADQAALQAALDAFLRETSRTGRPQSAPLSIAQLQALGDISRRVQTLILIVAKPSAGSPPAEGKNMQTSSQYTLAGELTTTQVAGPAWAKNQPLYQAYPHDGWGPQYQPGSYFRRTEALLPALQEMGIGIVWMLPLHPRGPAPGAAPPPHISKSARLPSDSPYSVRDYYAIDPHWGTGADLTRMIHRAHALGLHVLMDWVPNHTSWGNALLTQHPEFYKKDADGNIDYAHPWTDVAQLDYGNHAVWAYMRDALVYWVRTYDVDGFRMDVAGNVPLAFWEWLRPQLNAVRPVLLLAESDDPRLHPAFDMTYNASLYPLLWGLARRGVDDQANTLTATAIDTLLLKEAHAYPPGAVRMNHLDNHDLNPTTNPWVWGYGDVKNKLPGDTVLVRYGDGYRAFSVLTATLPGKPMVYNGQENYTPGSPALPPVPDTLQKLQSAPNYDFYRRLLTTYRAHPALYEGEFLKVPSDHDAAIYAFIRRRGTDQALVVLNLSDAPQQATLQSDALPGRYHEVFTDAALSCTSATRLSLDPWAYRLYLKQP